MHSISRHCQKFSRVIALIALMFPLLAQSAGFQAANPVIWADVPDPSVIRVGDSYYMSSTTMHMNPGVPIMKSKDLINWTLHSYVYQKLSDGAAMNLENGENSYGRGSWASSLRYHQGKYYLSTFANNTGRTYIYSTDDIERGDWSVIELPKLYHDASLLFDEGRVFLIYGSGDIRIAELDPSSFQLKVDGVNRVLIEDASAIASDDIMLPAEGAQIQKINGYYYVSLITWPRGGMRTQLVYRSKTLLGSYEGKVVLQDRGIAQGSYIDDSEGNWFAFLFKDHGAVGRAPILIPVRWQGGWPILGERGKAPDVLESKIEPLGASAIVASDDFDYAADEPLQLAWQWNHNPVAEAWSHQKRKGFLRLSNHRIDSDFLNTHNTLTQRTFGPRSSAVVAIELKGMKVGDVAGFAALQENYGFVGVERNKSGRYLIFRQGNSKEVQELERIKLKQKRVYLKISTQFDEQKDQAQFHYSLDGKNWISFDQHLQMRYTLPHFMGYRFALFNYATKKTGGYVDFDFYKVGAE